jgi:aminoglycoside phosphotransferase (APT) family kinase protein
MDRREDAAFVWVEELTGAEVTGRRLHARWRPHWYLDLQGPASAPDRVMLRGFRNPGYLGDESMMRAWLGREATVIEVLQDTPVKVPRFYGHETDLGWLCMEWLDGDECLSAIADDDRRGALFREYLDTIVELHHLDLATVGLPDDFPRPTSDEQAVGGTLQLVTMLYRAAAANGGDPEPLIELGLWWAGANMPDHAHPIALCGGDIGPDQFFFDDAGVRAMFDLELAHVGDPYEDLGLMRMREMCYPIGELDAHYRYYAERSGAPLDLATLQYWTMIGMLSGPMWMWERVQRPDPHLIDQIPIYSWDPIYRRGIAETLLEAYDVAPDRPQRPPELETPRTRLHDLLTQQVTDVIAPAMGDPAEQFRLRTVAALAEALALGNALGPQIDDADVEDLAAALGRRPADRRAGLATLQEQILEDPEHDLESRLRCLHRIQVRQEFLYEPIQRAMGFASNQPLTRMT